MSKTPIYTKKAIARYNAKFDRFTVNIPKGIKEIISNDIGMSYNSYINMLIENDLKTRGLLPAQPAADPAADNMEPPF